MKITNTEFIDSKDNKYYVLCESYETQYNWGHKVRIVDNETMRALAYNKCVYYNRTWERYRYQSCILGAIQSLKEQAIDDYKQTHNIKRLTQKMRDFIIANDEEYKYWQAQYEYFDKEYRG